MADIQVHERRTRGAPEERPRFVILAVPRSGSNLLCTLLDSHPDILCHHELFNPRGIFYALPLRETGFAVATLAERERDPLAFLERVWQHGLGKQHIGFKMTRGQAESVLESVVRDPGVAKIILRRANLIKTVASFKIATVLDQWEVYDAATLASERPKIRLTATELAAHEQADEDFYRMIERGLEQTGQRALTVWYERLSTEGTRARLLSFLGARMQALGARSVEQNSRDLRDLISNFDELAAELRGTRWQDQLFDTEM